MTLKSKPPKTTPNPGAQKTRKVLSIQDFLEKTPATMPPSQPQENEDFSEGQVIDLDSIRNLKSSKEGFLLAIQQLEEALAERIAWPHLLKVEKHNED